jgi:hypothetical protein
MYIHELMVTTGRGGRDKRGRRRTNSFVPLDQLAGSHASGGGTVVLMVVAVHCGHQQSASPA